jgi:hypothetical protein
MMPGPRCWQTCWGGWPGTFPAGDPAVLRPDGARAADGTDDRNCQPVAEAIGHRGPHRLQHLPAEITRVWAANTWDSGEGFRWSPAKAWERFAKIEPQHAGGSQSNQRAWPQACRRARASAERARSRSSRPWSRATRCCYTDETHHRTDSARYAGIIRRDVPRTVPRDRSQHSITVTERNDRNPSQRCRNFTTWRRQRAHWSHATARSVVVTHAFDCSAHVYSLRPLHGADL